MFAHGSNHFRITGKPENHNDPYIFSALEQQVSCAQCGQTSISAIARLQNCKGYLERVMCREELKFRCFSADVASRPVTSLGHQ